MAVGRMTTEKARLLSDGVTINPGAQAHVARRAAEVAALAAIKAGATPPDTCGPEIPVAPARGAFRVFQPMEIIPGTQGRRRAGFAGRDALARADVFDDMLAKAQARAAATDAAFVWPLTSSQIAMARFYRDLTERHDAGGMRCASLEAGRGGGGSGEFIDAYVQEGRQLAALHARIGAGVAMVVRRVRPSLRGGTAASVIPDRRLVDMVCLAQLSFAGVLVAFGWSRDGHHRARLRQALAAALDRMQGYRVK